MHSVRGMDIGCGANLIYPLLGTTVYEWHFVAVDIVTAALAGARRNLQLNSHLDSLIDVRDAKDVKLATSAAGSEDQSSFEVLVMNQLSSMFQDALG